MEVVGIENVKYLSKKTGNYVEGVRLHLMDDLLPGTDNGHGDGKAVSVEFVSVDKAVGIAVGDRVHLFYNKFGRIDSVQII